MKIVMVSGMLPDGHYSQYITYGLNKISDLIVYTDRRTENLDIKDSGTIKLVWRKSPLFLVDILKELLKDRPDIVHYQHEMNMYGGPLTAVMFPILVLITRLFGFKIVTTVHAAVYKHQINTDFISTFGFDSSKFKPWMIRLLFMYIYPAIGLFSNAIIVHTNLTKDILTNDYLYSSKKVNVVPIAIPQRCIDNTYKEKYFFYFGYMVRRKGLGFLLYGFKKFTEKFPESGFRLVLAGGKIKGQEKSYDEILDEIKNFGLENKVEVRGFINMFQQDELYQKAYAVVIPAILSMGSSGPLFHSNSYGKCPIATNIGYFIEDIINLKTGILTDNSNWDTVLEFAYKNPEVVSEIEKNVAEKARARSPEITADNYMKIYKTI